MRDLELAPPCRYSKVLPPTVLPSDFHRPSRNSTWPLRELRSRAPCPGETSRKMATAPDSKPASESLAGSTPALSSTASCERSEQLVRPLVSVAKLEKAPPYEGDNCRFESCRGYLTKDRRSWRAGLGCNPGAFTLSTFDSCIFHISPPKHKWLVQRSCKA